jgi:DNA adenine methylase
MGRYKNPLICDPEGLRAAARVLAGAKIVHADYRAAVADARAGDLVYFDPPYDPVTSTANFVSYTADAFGPDDQRALAELTRSLIDRGVAVVLSNSDTALIRSLYKGLRIDRVRCARAINCNADRRGDVDDSGPRRRPPAAPANAPGSDGALTPRNARATARRARSPKPARPS